MLHISTTVTHIETNFLIGVYSWIQILSDPECSGVWFSWRVAVCFGSERRIKWSARFRSQAKFGFCISATKFIMVWQSHALTCSHHVENTCDLLERRLIALGETPHSKANLWETASADCGCCRQCALGAQNHWNMFRLFNCKYKKQWKRKLSGTNCSFYLAFVVITLGTSAAFLFLRLGLRCAAAAQPESRREELSTVPLSTKAYFGKSLSYYLQLSVLDNTFWRSLFPKSKQWQKLNGCQKICVQQTLWSPKY